MDIGKIEFGPLTKDHLAGMADAGARIAQSLMAERDAAQRELAAYKLSVSELTACVADMPVATVARRIENRVRELLAANAQAKAP